MEISLSRFVQLTALLASGGTLVTACTINNVEDADAGAAGSSSIGTGGSLNSGGASSATGGATSAGTSSLSTGGATGTAVAGATSTAGAAATGGTATTSGGSGTSIAGNTSTATGGKATTGGASSTVAGNSSTGGKTATGGATGAGGNTSATGGTATATGGSTSTCVSGDPAAEGEGFDCSTLSYASQTCPDPSGEGAISPYGVSLCNEYSAERVGSVKVLTDCLSKLTVPASGWCGAEHQAAADACRSQMESRTCPSNAAQTGCTGINAMCSSVAVATCVADLSPLSDANVALVDTCMEGASAAPSLCGTLYLACAGYVSFVVSVTDACNQIVQGCTGVSTTTCQSALDTAQTGAITGLQYSTVVACMVGTMMAASPCDEAFSICTAI